MATMAQTPMGAREALEGLSKLPSAANIGDSPRTSSEGRSPRCEAFVMTGDKILNLTPNISPGYAKLAKEQLPPGMTVHDTPKRAISPSEFPSVRRSVRSRLSANNDGQRRPLFEKDRSSSNESPVTSPSVQSPTSPPPGISLADELAEASTSENTPPPSQPMISPTAPPSDPEPTPKQTPPEQRRPSGGVAPPHSSSLIQSHHSTTAVSNPQLTSSRQRSGSTDTFVIQVHRSDSTTTFVISSQSPTKQSSVTVNAVAASESHQSMMTPSVSGHCTPAFKRIVSPSVARSVDSSRCDEQKDAAVRLATRLFCLNGFTRAEVAQQLDLENDFAQLVSAHYVSLLQFSGIRIDAALREFLTRVELIGETAQREKLLRHFSTRYHTCNPALFASSEEVHALTCALLLLNSDLHGPNCGKRMSVRDFVNNLAHTGGTYDRVLLKNVYASIKQTPIVSDTESPSSAHPGCDPSGSVVQPPLLRLAEVDPESQVEYKAGWVMRKCVYDADGSKTPMGRRGWRMWYVRLRGLALYLDRDENARKRSKWETFSNSILLHHAIAEPALDYKKKQHCFRVRTANLGEYLFITSNAAEVSSWVEQINFVCACFSAKALPPATGSMTSFTRPRLPNLPSTASLPEQLRNHDSSAQELRSQLIAVQKDAPPLKSRGRAVEEYFFKERLLMKEIERYEAYVQVLRDRLGPSVLAKMGGGSSDSTSGVHSKSDIGDDLDKISYREAMHQM